MPTGAAEAANGVATNIANAAIADRMSREIFIVLSLVGTKTRTRAY
jgi:hypothetical protein